MATHKTPRTTTNWELNSLRPRRNGRYNADDIFKCIFLKENAWMPTKSSLTFVRKGPINNIPALVQIMAWRRPGDKPLSEPMMVSLLTLICVTRPQWVNACIWGIWHIIWCISLMFPQTYAKAQYDTVIRWLIFSKITTIDSLYLAREGEVWSVLL